MGLPKNEMGHNRRDLIYIKGGVMARFDKLTTRQERICSQQFENLCKDKIDEKYQKVQRKDVEKVCFPKLSSLEDDVYRRKETNQCSYIKNKGKNPQNEKICDLKECRDIDEFILLSLPLHKFFLHFSAHTQ
jgi:hypothetical protein